jgi:hypothetical protein
LTPSPTSESESTYADHQAGLGRYRTDNAEPTVSFFHELLGLRLQLDRPGFWMLKLPDGRRWRSSDLTVRSTATPPPARSPGSWSTTSRARPPNCAPPAWRSSTSQASTPVGTPGYTSAPRTEISMSSPKTLASLDRTEADGDGRSRRRLSPPQSRATWTSSSPTAGPGARRPGRCRRRPSSIAATLESQVLIVSGGQRRTFVSTAGLARAFCCRGSRHAGSGPKPASASKPELDRLPPGDG